MDKERKSKIKKVEPNANQHTEAGRKGITPLNELIKGIAFHQPLAVWGMKIPAMGHQPRGP